MGFPEIYWDIMYFNGIVWDLMGWFDGDFMEMNDVFSWDSSWFNGSERDSKGFHGIYPGIFSPSLWNVDHGSGWFMINYILQNGDFPATPNHQRAPSKFGEDCRQTWWYSSYILGIFCRIFNKFDVPPGHLRPGFTSQDPFTMVETQRLFRASKLVRILKKWLQLARSFAKMHFKGNMMINWKMKAVGWAQKWCV